MDRLLRLLLRQFVRRGAIKVAAASGAEFICGDEIESPVSIRFLTRKLSVESFWIRSLRSAKPSWKGRSSSRRVRSRMFWQSCSISLKSCRAGPSCDGGCDISAATCNSIIHARDRNPTSPATMTSTKDCNPCSSIMTGNTAVRISRPLTRRWTMLNWQKKLSGRQVADRTRQARSRHRIGLGRTWALSCGNDRRRSHWDQPVGRANPGIERAGRAEAPRSAKFILQDYRDISGPFDRIVSVGMLEHVGLDFYETVLQRNAPSFQTTHGYQEMRLSSLVGSMA